MKNLIVGLFMAVAALLPCAAQTTAPTSLPTASTLGSGDLVVGVQGGQLVIISQAQMQAWAQGNSLLSTGTYTNPTWLVSIPFSKLTSTPTSLSGYGITDPVVLTTGSYANPSWITSLAASKVTGLATYVTTSGTNIYTATPSPALTSYATGLTVRVTFGNANTGGASLNLNSLGAVPIQQRGSALAAGAISAGATMDLVYDGANFQVVGNSSLPTIGNNDLLANTSGSAATPVDTSVSALLDSSIGSGQGSLLERGASGWSLIGPGTSGYLLTSNGTGADPTYQAPPSSSVSIGTTLASAGFTYSSGVLDVPSGFSEAGQLLQLTNTVSYPALFNGNVFQVGGFAFEDGSGAIDTTSGDGITTYALGGGSGTQGQIMVLDTTDSPHGFLAADRATVFVSGASSGTVSFATSHLMPDKTIYLSFGSTISSITIARDTTTRVGQIFRVVSLSAVTSFAVSGGTSALSNDPSSLTAGQSISWQATSTSGTYIRLY